MSFELPAACYRVLMVFATTLLVAGAARAEDATIDELIAEGHKAIAQGEFEQAGETAEKAVKLDPTNSHGWLIRGMVSEHHKKHAEAIADFNRALELNPKFAVVYDLRGNSHFKAGEIQKSIDDFDRYLELMPGQKPHHWRRGISLYYAGRFDDGAKQFELHQTVNNNDVENAAWRYIRMARGSAGVDAARSDLLVIERDTRVPMMEIYALFAGKGTADEVLKAAEAGKPAPAQLKERLFYAHLYLGLYYEATGDAPKAREHILLAADEFYVPHYMGDVARVHAALLKEKAE
jgi:lipoprotein NlpI